MKPFDYLDYVLRCISSENAELEFVSKDDYEKDHIINNFEVNIRLHEKFNSPIFMLYSSWHDGNNVVVNPILKDMNFQVVFDPYRAFQRIDMFLSGVMQSSENKMVKISDKIRKYKHGFDETSFRPKMKKLIKRRN